MYNVKPNLWLGFHGCDKEVGLNLLNNPKSIKFSKNDYDWLGHGFYVWENNYDRALQWASEKADRVGRNKYQPFVLGVVYTLDNCFDLTDKESLDLLKQGYLSFSEIKKGNVPTNKDIKEDTNKDKILRELDCAVINFTCDIVEVIGKENPLKYKPFDTVRGVFTEGGPAFQGASIQSKTHIQVSIRNNACIKGFFLPRNI